MPDDGMTPNEKINTLISIAALMKDVNVQKEQLDDKIIATFIVYR